MGHGKRGSLATVLSSTDMPVWRWATPLLVIQQQQQQPVTSLQYRRPAQYRIGTLVVAFSLHVWVFKRAVLDLVSLLYLLAGKLTSTALRLLEDAMEDAWYPYRTSARL